MYSKFTKYTEKWLPVYNKINTRYISLFNIRNNTRSAEIFPPPGLFFKGGRWEPRTLDTLCISKYSTDVSQYLQQKIFR